MIRVSTGTQIEISGLKLDAARMLTPPIHPRVPTEDVPKVLRRLISRADRGGVIRFA